MIRGALAAAVVADGQEPMVQGRTGLIVDAYFLATKTATPAATAMPQSRVYLVPAFVGLGASHWDADARAALLGMTLEDDPWRETRNELPLEAKSKYHTDRQDT